MGQAAQTQQEFGALMERQIAQCEGMIEAFPETEVDLHTVDAISALAAFPGVIVTHDRGSCRFPTPRDVAGSDQVWVGRVRKDLGSEKIWMWEVSDNLRKGAATNAVQIAEALLERKLLGRCGVI